MPLSLAEAIPAIRSGQSLERDEMRAIMDEMVSGSVPDPLIAELLGALHQKGETVGELVGAALALRERMEVLQSTRSGIVDTCGTGGSGIPVFNISTVAALIAAAAGATVAKHGNRRSSGTSGSSDVLAELGVNVQAPLPVVQRCLEQLGLCFCFAPLHHPSVRNVMNVRRSLSHPTLFNWLGPLCNPARAEFQLLGSGQAATHRILAEALREIGVRQAAVVHSRDGLGELSGGAITDGWWIEQDSMRPVTFESSEFGLPPAPLEGLLVSDPASSANRIREVLAGSPGPARSIALLNAAAVLLVCGRAESPREAALQAAEAVDSGRARQLLADLVRLTRSGS